MTTNVEPHGPPMDKSTFTTVYDATFTRPVRFAAPWRPSNNDATGHLRNITPYIQGVSFGQPKSVSHTVHSCQKDDLAGNVRETVSLLGKPQSIATAHIRNQPHQLGSHDAVTYKSTMKADYGPKPVGEGKLSSKFAGNSAAQYDPDFLSINSETEQPKPKRCASAPHVPWRTRRDGLSKMGSADPLHYGPLHPLQEQKMRVADPVEYLVYKKRSIYQTQNQIYGDTKSVQRPGTAKIEMGDVLGEGERYAVNNKRSLLLMLSGRQVRPSTAAPREDGINPIKLDHVQGEKSYVSKRLEYEGHVKPTVYNTSFINQWVLPEPSGKVSHASTVKKEYSVRLIKHPVPKHSDTGMFKADGTLAEKKPAHIHDSLWRYLKRKEEKNIGANLNKHAHKIHVV